MGGQLDVDVVGRPQRGGDLVAGAAGAADVDHDPQRIPPGDARPADEALADDRHARHRVDRRARRASRRRSSLEQRLAVDGELAAGGVERGHQQRARAGRADEPHGAGDGVGVDQRAVADEQHRRLGEAADDLVGRGEHRVGAEPQRRLGQRRVKAEVRAPGVVDDQRHPGRVGDLGAAGDVGGHPVVGRRDDERGAGVRAPARAPRSSASGVTPWAIPSSASYSGATNVARPPLSTSPSIRLACELRWITTCAAERRERQAQRVVALGGAVGEKPRPRGAVGLGGQLLGALVRRRRRPDVDALDVLGHVEQQRALARARCAARDRRPRRPCGRGRGSGSSRGTRRR